MQEIDSLLKDLSNADWWVRSSAIKNLLNYPAEYFMSFIEKALRDNENATLRNASMEFLAALDGRALEFLCRLIRDADPEMRIFAANTLGEIKKREALSVLTASMKDPDVNVRAASAEALGKIGDPEATAVLAEALDDESWVVMAAIKALGDIGGDVALDVLCECLEREEYRGITFEAIERAGNHRSISLLMPFVDRDELREFALKAIVNIAEREGIKLSEKFFINLVPMLIDLQRSSHPDIRRAAFIALTWDEDIRGLPYFIDALNDEELQERALKYLIGLGTKAAPGIIEALKEPERPQRSILARLLSMMGEYPVLIGFSEDEDPEVRVEAALALGRIGSAQAVGVLSRMLSDTFDEVREAARRALDCSGRLT